MNTLKVEAHPLAQDVKFSESELIVSLVDGRVILVRCQRIKVLAVLRSVNIMGNTKFRQIIRRVTSPLQ